HRSRRRVNDQAVVATQLDRPLRADVEVVVRCHLDLPVVVSVPPVLDDTTPFPTRYWLSCPLAGKRVARLESAGAIARLEAFVAADPGLRRDVRDADLRYAADRDALVPSGVTHSPSGGVGGNEGSGLKCLHAHYADSAAGNANPIGDFVRPYVEPLDCEVPCVHAKAGGVEPNKDWREMR
ncbi:MAG: DUF501 domain-containing protein, partial [Acidimicrobiia bacterium]